ncbi:hypothetical protein KEM48_000507 [Puccinia striiformis f. sp. tritici PST-130]|nr:hypothetical protein KEM48_000507 [Puccinia striiformis f. sp. tritici PST-130]
MALSEYARSEYEEDSEFVLSDEEEEQAEPQTSPIDKPQLEILDNQPQISRSAPSSIISNDATKFINHVDLVMNKIKTLESDNRWHRVLKHRTGVQVYAQKHAKTIGKSKTVPVFKGVGLIKGYSPASVFAVIGSSKLWDEWYEDGNLVENLSDQVSLTYMCMKAGIGTRTRDLSLVEKVEATAEGSIYFCASSVDTPRVPIVPGRIRAHIELNGWVLEPITLPESSAGGGSTTATKVTYYLQVNVNSFVAEAVSKRYLARRPLCITKIDSYLQKYGSPVQLEGISDIEAHPRLGGNRRSYSRNFMSVKQLDSPKDSSFNGDNGSVTTPNSLSSRGMRAHLPSIGSFGQKTRARLPSAASVPSLNRNSSQEPNVRKSTKSIHLDNLPTTINPIVKPQSEQKQEKPPQPQAPPLIDHLEPNHQSPHWNSITQALELFNSYLNDSITNQGDWQSIEDSNSSVRIWLNSNLRKANPSDSEGLFELPIIKSQAILSNVDHPITIEQITSTILSNSSRQNWDQNFEGCSLTGTETGNQILLKNENGFDHQVIFSSMRSIYPHLKHESLFFYDRLVFRYPPSSSSPSKIIILYHSVKDEQDFLNRLENDKSDLNISLLLKEKIMSKCLSKINVSGYVIENINERSSQSSQIRITHLSSLSINLKNQSSSSTSTTPMTTNEVSLPPFLSRLICTNIGNRPYQIHQLIDRFGFFPGFVKWGKGHILFDGDCSDEEFENGTIHWKFHCKLGSSSVEEPTIGSQICWFQWSSKMYPHGIDLSLEPSSDPVVVIVKKVKEFKNTLQFEWLKPSTNVKKIELTETTPTTTSQDQVITLKARRIQSSSDHSSSDDLVIFNGNKSLELVSSNHFLKPSSPLDILPPLVSTPNVTHSENDNVVDSDQVKEKSTTHIEDPSASNLPPPPISDNRISAEKTDLKDKKIPNQIHSNNHHQKQVLVDRNVAIILTKDIVFTRSQVGLFFLIIGLAVLFNRRLHLIFQLIY